MCDVCGLVHCRDIRAKRAFWGQNAGISRQSTLMEDLDV